MSQPKSMLIEDIGWDNHEKKDVDLPKNVIIIGGEDLDSPIVNCLLKSRYGVEPENYEGNVIDNDSFGNYPNADILTLSLVPSKN